jgi:hypothetical protein
MKLWIIYKEEIIISKIISEMLQDRLEDYMDISVGNAKKLDPAFIVEEKLDYLIIGDTISETIPSVEIQEWLLKYREISKINNLILKAISGFYIALTDIKNETLWAEFLQDNINTEIIYPPILCLKLKNAESPLKIGVLEIVKDYSNDLIEFLLKKNKGIKS